MRLLLDTHVLLWWLTESRALPEIAREAISDPNSVVFVSVVSVWEIAIKRALGKLDFSVAEISNFLEEDGFTPLAIELDHAVRAGALPMHHSDPFDRMLVAQAQHEGLTIITSDKLICRYQVAILGA